LQQGENIGKEQARVKRVFDHLEMKRRNLRVRVVSRIGYGNHLQAQLECKKHEMKQLEVEKMMETRRCDVLARDAYLAGKTADGARKALADKLFLGAVITPVDSTGRGVCRRESEVPRVSGE
jgi:hypothetical protein